MGNTIIQNLVNVPKTSSNPTKLVVPEDPKVFENRLGEYKNIRSQLSTPQAQVMANVLTEFEGKQLPDSKALLAMYNKACVTYGVPAGVMAGKDAQLLTQLASTINIKDFKAADLSTALSQATSQPTEMSPAEKKYQAAAADFEKKNAEFIKADGQYNTDSKQFQENMAKFQKDNAEYLKNLAAFKKDPMTNVPASIVGGFEVRVPVQKGLGEETEASLVGSAPLGKVGNAALRLEAALRKGQESGAVNGNIGVGIYGQPNKIGGVASWYGRARIDTGIPVAKKTDKITITTPQTQVNTTAGAGTKIESETTSSADGSISRTGETGRTEVPGSTSSAIESGTPTTITNSNLSVTNHFGVLGEGGLTFGAMQNGTSGLGAQVYGDISAVPGAGIGVGLGARGGYTQTFGIAGMPASFSAMVEHNHRLTGPSEGRDSTALYGQFNLGGGAPAGMAHPIVDGDIKALQENADNLLKN